MKKTLLTAAAIFASVYFNTAQAQTETIYDKGFDTEADGIDFIRFDMDGDGYSWGINPEGAVGQEEFNINGGWLFSMSWIRINNVDTPLTPDNILITPAFALNPGAGSSATITMAGLDPDFYAESYAIYAVSEATLGPILDDINGEILPPDALFDYLGTPVVEGTLQSTYAFDIPIDLNDFAGEEVRLVFRHYNSTDNYVLLIDRIQVQTASLSLKDNVAEQLAVFPNPAKDVLQIQSLNGLVIENTIIRDINGRVVKNNSINNVNGQINVQDLAQGVYTIELHSKDGNAVKKFIKS